MKVWFDGALQRKTAAMSDWKQTSILTIPELTRVVAIKCRNKGGVMGLIASTSTGLKTDTSWQCSGVPVTNWTLPGFVSPPNTFANALNGGKNGVRPWNFRLPHFFSCHAVLADLYLSLVVVVSALLDTKNYI